VPNYAIITLDIDIPAISSVSPVGGSQDVAVETPLIFTLADMLTELDIATLELTIAGEQAISGGAFQSGYAGQIIQAGSVYSISVTKSNGWPGSADIAYEIRIQDTVGNELLYQGSFYTAAGWTELSGEWVNLEEDGTSI